MNLINTLAILVLALPGLASAEDWYPSKWGANDTLGAINEITPDKIVAAAKLVTQGKRYALGMVTSRDTPTAESRSFELFTSSNGMGKPTGLNKVTGIDDWAKVYFGVGTQIDGLGHASIDNTHYNGNHISDIYTPTGLSKLGIDQLPPIVARGVILDMVSYFRKQDSSRLMTVGGVDMLKGGTAINRKEIEGALALQSLALKDGDVILVHTGYMHLGKVDKQQFMATSPGLGVEGALFLAGHNPVAIGADNVAVEVMPAEVEGYYAPVHTEILVKRGIYLLENIVTQELAKDEAWEFMFILGQARLKGAVQMIVNPVAIR